MLMRSGKPSRSRILVLILLALAMPLAVVATTVHAFEAYTQPAPPPSLTAPALNELDLSLWGDYRTPPPNAWNPSAEAFTAVTSPPLYLDQRPQLNSYLSQQNTVDYDADVDGLIEVPNLAKLNAIRWDPDGDGVATDSGYGAAFPEMVSGMGCPATGCSGYELTRSLDFNDPASYASGQVNTGWTTGLGWLPINWLDSTLAGNGHTVSNLYINRPDRSCRATRLKTYN